MPRLTDPDKSQVSCSGCQGHGGQESSLCCRPITLQFAEDLGSAGQQATFREGNTDFGMILFKSFYFVLSTK